MLELRGYQRRSLEELEAYLRLVGEHGAKAAFETETPRPYLPVAQLPELPYVCLRVPTGGGKTLMACHALGIAVREYLHCERAVCLWLVPSNAIRDQTLRALRDREHPYRQAVDARFAGQVTVVDLAEALYLTRSRLEGETVILVSTLQAFRVEDTEGRKVYEASGALSHHFTGLTAQLEEGLERTEGGSIVPSLANVLRLWRPVVIVDEAHNARTELSFETLARFSPSCIIEFTATPETTHRPAAGKYASNVLCHVSAAELKAEEMVKLPIKLHTREEWREAVGAAVRMQRALEEVARAEEREKGEYIRPIVLLQAQPRSQQRQTVTVEVLKRSLVEDFRVPEEQVAVATGETREIDDVDLSDRACEIRFIITVAALKEGWDCPFAYVLCSVSEIGSQRAVEQILGRVLRLPGAKWKQRAELNWAYAFASSQRFQEAANALADALIQNGFERLEARDLVVAADESGVFTEGLFGEVSALVEERPELSALNPELRQRVAYDAGSGRLTVAGGIRMAAEKEAILSCVRTVAGKAAVEEMYRRSQGAVTVKPLAPRPAAPMRVPALAVWVGDQLELLEEWHFLDAPWDLTECSPHLSPDEFAPGAPAEAVAEVDISAAGKVEIRFVDEVRQQLALLSVESGWTTASLANWIDRQIRHPDIPQSQSSLFIHRVLTGLMESRGLSIEGLAFHKFRACSAIAARINGYRLLQRKQGYQQLLFGEGREKIEVGPEVCLTLEEERYAPNRRYEGNYQFTKHSFLAIGEMDGEEADCAVEMERLPQVKQWVRNVERRELGCFWLPTSTDRFYPDFVALLEDGRYLVVEYKGEYLWSNDDSKEKRAVGALWAERSGGRCLFVMPKGKDWEAIRRCVAAGGG